MAHSDRDPAVSRELVEWLEKRFPDRVPDVDASVDEIRARSGEQRVVRLLRRTHDSQTTKALGSI